jgi:hypothetical protein
MSAIHAALMGSDRTSNAGVMVSNCGPRIGMSPIPVSELPTSISDALLVLDSTADRLQCLDLILGARLEAEGGRLYRAVIEYILTCFRSHNPAISLESVIAGPVAATKDAA